MLQLRRRIDSRDFFWLANNTGERQQCTLSIRDIAGGASIWNCENGTISEVPSMESDGRTRVTVGFEAYEALWLVIDPKSKASKVDEIKKSRRVNVDTLKGHWHVRIDTTAQPIMPVPRPDLPAEMLSESGVEKPLESWLNWGLNQFTGYVDYTTNFACAADAGHFMLNLGDVKYMAEVWVNGEDVGHQLWPPFKFDLGHTMHQGDNRIKIRIGNLLSNAMKQEGDSGLFGPVILMQEVKE